VNDLHSALMTVGGQQGTEHFLFIVSSTSYSFYHHATHTVNICSIHQLMYITELTFDGRKSGIFMRYCSMTPISDGWHGSGTMPRCAAKSLHVYVGYRSRIEASCTLMFNALHAELMPSTKKLRNSQSRLRPSRNPGRVGLYVDRV